MDVISFNIFLEYLYRKFITTFILCLIGAIVRETMNTVKLDMINARKMIASVVFASVLMCAFADNVKVPFSLYTIICIIAGIWAQTILKLIMNAKFMVKLIRKVASSVKDPLVKSIASSIDELEEESVEDDVDDSS